MPARKINTFVFFDLEGTGLTDNPRVTEITMLAMHRSAGEEMIYRARKSMWAPGGSDPPPDLPRVINKLTITIYPMKPIAFEASEITGLNNDNLYQQKDFDPEVGDLLRLFLRRLEPPVCLVAHNGHRFDFPLLLAELQSTGCKPLILANDEPVLCLDTFEMFRDLAADPVNFPNRYLRESSAETPPATPTPEQNGEKRKSDDESPGKAENGDGDTTVSSQENEHTPSGSSQPANEAGSVVGKKERLDSENADDNDGEHVAGSSSASSRARRRLFPDDDSNDTAAAHDSGMETGDLSDESLLQHAAIEEKTASAGTTKPSVAAVLMKTTSGAQKSTGPTPPKKSLIRPVHAPAAAPPAATAADGANIPLRPLCGTTHFKPRINAVMTVAKRPSYKLVDLHQRIIGFEPVDSHRAEDDCVTLARIFWLTPKAMHWADHNAIGFDRFRPLYATRRRPLPPGKFPSSC